MTGRLQSLDAIRGYAILCVAVAHAVQHVQDRPSWLEPFVSLWYGVDLFLVLSGFIVTRAWLAAEQAGQSFAGAASRHLVRRFTRILPPALLALALYWLQARLGGHPTAGMEREIGLILTGRYPFSFAEGAPAPLGIFWSLVVEAHFYLVLPVVMGVARARWARMAVFALLAGTSVLHFRWARGCLLDFCVEGVTWYSTFHRFEGIAMGALTALGLSSPAGQAALASLRSRVPGVAAALLAVGALGLVAFAPWLRARGWLPGGWDLILGAAVASTLALKLALAWPERRPSRLFRAFAWLGVRCYALYLTHILVFRVVGPVLWRAVAGRPDGALLHDLAFVPLGLLSAVLFAALWFRLIEEPSHRLARRLS